MVTRGIRLLIQKKALRGAERSFSNLLIEKFRHESSERPPWWAKWRLASSSATRT